MEALSGLLPSCTWTLSLRCVVRIAGSLAVIAWSLLSVSQSAMCQDYHRSQRVQVQEIPRPTDQREISTRRDRKVRQVVFQEYESPEDEVAPITASAEVELSQYRMIAKLTFEGLSPGESNLAAKDFQIREQNSSKPIIISFEIDDRDRVILTTRQSLNSGIYIIELVGQFLGSDGSSHVEISDSRIVLPIDIAIPTPMEELNRTVIKAVEQTKVSGLQLGRMVVSESDPNTDPAFVPHSKFNQKMILAEDWLARVNFSRNVAAETGDSFATSYYLEIGQDRKRLPPPKFPGTPSTSQAGEVYPVELDVKDLRWLSKFDGTSVSARIVVEIETNPITTLISDPFVLQIDTTPPRVVTHRPFVENSSLHVEVIFADDDVEDLVPEKIQLLSTNLSGTPIGQGHSGLSIKQNLKQGNRRTVVISTGLNTGGTYKLSFQEVVDSAGNQVDSIPLTVSIAADVVQNLSPAVEFPEYLGGRTGTGESRRFNPADYVETRVARLFYFRDAHRVAQIINRITQSYNRAAVTQAEQRYEEAKNRFDQLVIERKTSESNAIRLAQDTRTAERKLEALYQKQNAMRREQASRPTDPTVTNFEQTRRNAIAESDLQDQLFELRMERSDVELVLKKTNDRIRELNASSNGDNESQREVDRLKERALNQERRKQRLDNEILQVRRQITILQDDPRLKDPNLTVDGITVTELGQIQSQIDSQESVVQAARTAEADAKDAVQQAVLNEELAAKNHFELLASARNKDPDTYAPANVDSVDPVARVSVSVIGEGMIQLRGPLNGINKIRMMMHQIDSPRGQVKVDINTVQINGEDRRRMEKVAGNVEANIGLGRHLTMQSLELLRRAIVEEATRVAQFSCAGFPSQHERDQKYLYAFFGEDFINELRDMDSEFLRSENKILSLHSMDVVSPSNALFIFLLARNDVQHNICNTFFQLVESELPQIDWEHRSALEIFPHQTRQHLPFTNRNKINRNTQTRVYRNAIQRYKFRNFKTFFQSHSFGQDVLNPTQREFIRLAQIFKSQMIAEQEVKQRIVERSLIEDGVLDDIQQEDRFRQKLRSELSSTLLSIPAKLRDLKRNLNKIKTEKGKMLDDAYISRNYSPATLLALSMAEDALQEAQFNFEEGHDNDALFNKLKDLKLAFSNAMQSETDGEVRRQLVNTFEEIVKVENLLLEMKFEKRDARAYRKLLAQFRRPNNERKLLDFLIEEKLEKQIELLEGTRAQISVMDNYIKRLITALEDDFQAQFYDPSFIRMRTAASREVVNFSQAERTTLLMNNRDLGIVQPTATMEFDLPRRDILIVETLDTAKAIAQDYGALLQDPTYLAVFDMLGGGQVPGKTQKVLPGLPSLTDEYSLGLSDSSTGSAGSVLQSRVQDPAIYQFETGTGFEVRPVIQPDGHSLVYDFHYMYTSNVREPVRADEKHLGRVKRHFINTQVQTSSFEMREVGRYLVALKAARTGSGVPGLQDIPIVGRAFKPAPSAESSLQQNIVLAKSTVYPTLYDLMGLRWARQVVDLDHTNLRNDDYIVRERRRALENHVFDKTGALVDEVLGINDQSYHYRPDLYHPQEHPRNYQHPNGYYDPRVQQKNDQSRHYLPREENPGRQSWGAADPNAWRSQHQQPSSGDWRQYPQEDPCLNQGHLPWHGSNAPRLDPNHQGVLYEQAPGWPNGNQGLEEIRPSNNQNQSLDRRHPSTENQLPHPENGTRNFYRFHDRSWRSANRQTERQDMRYR